MPSSITIHCAAIANARNIDFSHKKCGLIYSSFFRDACDQGHVFEDWTLCITVPSSITIHCAAIANARNIDFSHKKSGLIYCSFF